MTLLARDNELAELRRLATVIEESLEAARRRDFAMASDGASALFTLFVRIDSDKEHVRGELVDLLKDRHAGRAVRAILKDPGRDWTLDELAARANASRATLVRIFRRIAKIAPLKFLTELRLELARRKLSATRLTLAQIASQIGYHSESAFSRAFRRRFGMPPRQARLAFQAGGLATNEITRALAEP